MIKGVNTIHGSGDGPTVAIVGGIHGDEIQTVRALNHLASRTSIQFGAVHFVLGNPEAVARGERYLEFNLNRLFSENTLRGSVDSTEHRRARELMELFGRCDGLLDIHTVKNPRTTPFVICRTEDFELVKYLDFPIRSNGWDQIEPGGTDDFMARRRKIGVCIECGYHEDPDVVSRASEAATTFLRLMGCVSGDRELRPTLDQRTVMATFAFKAVRPFRRAQPFPDFQPVAKGELIGWHGEEPFCATEDGILIFARDVSQNRLGAEAVVMGRSA